MIYYLFAVDSSKISASEDSNTYDCDVLTTRLSHFQDIAFTVRFLKGQIRYAKKQIDSLKNEVLEEEKTITGLDKLLDEESKCLKRLRGDLSSYKTLLHRLETSKIYKVAVNKNLAQVLGEAL